MLRLLLLEGLAEGRIDFVGTVIRKPKNFFLFFFFFFETGSPFVTQAGVQSRPPWLK